MPRADKAGTPVAIESEVLTSRHAELDDLTVVFEEYHVDADGTPVFQGLPDDRCQCPHWGVVVSGELRLRYADSAKRCSGPATPIWPGPAMSRPSHERE